MSKKEKETKKKAESVSECDKIEEERCSIKYQMVLRCRKLAHNSSSLPCPLLT